MDAKEWANEIGRELREPVWQRYGLIQNDHYIAVNEKSMAMIEEAFGSAPKEVYEPYMYGIPVRTKYEPYLYGIPVRIKKDVPDGEVWLIHEETLFKYNPTKEERYVFDEE